MIRSLLRLPPALLLAVSLLSACDGPTAPDRLLVEAVEGNAQEALPGDTLPQLIGVRVTRPDGSPAVGVAVRFRAAAGAGSVVASSGATDSYGMVRATWRLPAQAGAELVVTAEVEGAAEPARFTAGWLPRERADLLLAGVSTRVRLLLHPPAYMNSPLAFRAAFADSMIITPFSGGSGYADGVAFTEGHPPLVMRNLRWTPGRDTLRLDFPRPVEVPLTLWVVQRPYEASRAAMESQLQAARMVWEQAGVRFSDVRWVDATDSPDAGLMQGPTPACATGNVGADAGRTNVYVTGPPVHGNTVYGGYACSQGVIFITTTANYSGPTLLAHELGHTFGLVHNAPETVMNPNARSGRVTAGQIFHVHVSPTSAIQVLYPERAVGPPVLCPAPGSCLHPASDL